MHLRQAEILWKESKTAEALDEYNYALQLTVNNETKYGEILLGKGYAILNSTDSTIVNNKALQLEGIQNLEKAKEISIKLGNDRAAAFVQKIIDQKGKLHVHDTDSGSGNGSGSGSGDGCCKQGDNQPEDNTTCFAHDDVGKNAAAAAAAAVVSATMTANKSNNQWSEDMDERLISLVAKLGVHQWEEVSIAMKELEEEVESHLSVQVLQERWAVLKPFVKHELEHGDGMNKKRKCGHSCNTCPTRSTCELHAAVDIEDLY